MESIATFFIQNDSARNVTTCSVFPRDLRLIFGNVKANYFVLRIKDQSTLSVNNRSVANGSSSFAQRNFFRERPETIAGANLVRSERFRRKRRRNVSLGSGN